jgi:hypothetical protein
MKKFLLGLLFVGAMIQQLSAGEKGWFGFGVAVELEGFILNPTLKAVKLDTVEPEVPRGGKGNRGGR